VPAVKLRSVQPWVLSLRIIEKYLDPVEEQVAVLWAMQNGYLDSVPVEKVKQFQIKLQDYLRTRKESVLAAIVSKRALDKDLESELAAALDEFKSTNPL